MFKLLLTILGLNIKAIAKVPKRADIITMMAKAIIALGKFFDGFLTLLTYGEIFSHPPTAKTKIESEVKYLRLNVGIKLFQFKLIE